MNARTADELWQTIRKFSFDNLLVDAIERGDRCTVVEILDAITQGEVCAFEREKLYGILGGICEVRRYIYDNWTVKELNLFIREWDATPYVDKETAMGAPQMPTDAEDIAAWEKWKAEGQRAARQLEYFDFELHTIQKYALLVIGAKCYADCKGNNTSIALALDSEPFFGMTLTELESTLPPPIVKMLNVIDANARRGAEAAEGAQAGVSFLVHDRMGRQAANSKRGKESHEKAVRDEAKRAKRDVETALKRVAEDPDVKAGKYGAIIAACRRVCSRFRTLPGAKKNERIYLPLTKADGKPLTPETLARYYRERHGGKRGKE